jgi:DNA-binding CsgD family transcriptional regulator/tetratricopeptide (TPR) repeat protein
MGALLGRTAEITILNDAVSRLRLGHGQVCWVGGEPGIGKSALLDQVLTDAGGNGVEVLRASAGPHISDPWADLGGGEDVLEAAQKGPLAVAIENLQYADPTLSVIWHRLAAAAGTLPLLLIGSAGPVPRVLHIDALRADANLVIDLGPLDEAAATALYVLAQGEQPTPQKLADAGGNPRYLSGDRSIDRRLAALTPETRSLLRLAAVLGDRFDVDELAAVLGRRPAALADGLDEAHRAGLLDETGAHRPGLRGKTETGAYRVGLPDEPGRLAFRHGLIRRALAAELSTSLRSALHRQFAEALAERGAAFDTIAGHLRVAGGPGAPWVGRWLARLPEGVLRAAPEIAAEVLGPALDSPVLPPEVWEILASRLIRILTALGRDERADDLALTLLRDSADPGHRGTAWIARIAIAARHDELDRALVLIIEGLADPVLRPGFRAQLRAREASILLRRGEEERSREQAVRALREAEAAGDAVAAGYARHMLAHLDREPARALAHLDAALAGLAADEAPDLRLRLLNNRLAALNNLGRADEFEAAARQVPDTVARVGAARGAPLLLAVAMGCYDFGRWDTALDYLARMPEELPASLSIGRHGLAAMLHAHREEWTPAERHLAEGLRIPGGSGDVRIWSGYLIAADAMRAVTDRDLRRAADLLTTWLGSDAEFENRERYMWLPALMRVARELHDRDLEERIVEATATDAARPDALAMQQAAAWLCQAQLNDDADRLQEVARIYEEHGWTLMRAFATEETAVRLAAAGKIDQARAAFNDAVRGYAALGATWDVRRVDARLRPLGIRRGSRTLDQRPVSGWAALTDAERRVAELVATGKSNPEVASALFLSPRTVQTHVSRILRKLGYTSRMDLVRDGTTRR